MDEEVENDIDDEIESSPESSDLMDFEEEGFIREVEYDDGIGTDLDEEAAEGFLSNVVELDNYNFPDWDLK